MNQNPSIQTQEEKKRRRKLLFWWFFGISAILGLVSITVLALIPEETPAPVVDIFEGDVTLDEGDSQFLNISVRHTDEDLVYESLDESVVRFEAGTLIAVSEGITTVRVLNESRTAFDEINVRVNALPVSIVTVTLDGEVFTRENFVRVVDLTVNVPEGQVFEGFYTAGGRI